MEMPRLQHFEREIQEFMEALEDLPKWKANGEKATSGAGLLQLICSFSCLMKTSGIVLRCSSLILGGECPENGLVFIFDMTPNLRILESKYDHFHINIIHST